MLKYLMFSLAISLSCYEAAIYMQFREFYCTSSRKSLNISFCYTKTFARKYFTLNFEVVTFRKFEFSKVNFTIFRKNSIGSFDKVIGGDNIEVCKVYGLSSNQDIVKMLVSEIKRTSLGAIMDACNKAGTYKVLNISTSESPYVNLFPNGNYKTEVNVFDDLDDRIINATFTSRIFRK